MLEDLKSWLLDCKFQLYVGFCKEIQASIHITK